MPDELQDNQKQDDSNSAKGEEFLQQVRDDFRFFKAYWQENYDEAKKDMRFAAAIPPTDFTEDRKGQPCIWPDEISQYIKQANNNFRQNKRSIKISPKSEQAQDADAEHRQAYIRGIEDASKAPSIYVTAYESASQCGFGAWRVNLRITGPNGEQEPRIIRIPNQFTVYFDPEAREADRSDQAKCFVFDSMRQTTFARRYPKAKKRSFTGADTERAPDFFSGENIIVAEYWVRDEIETEDGEKRYKVTQYITNGVEVLEEHEWIGSWIPIIGVFGEELYIDEGGQSKLKIMSLIRRARDPQQMLAYVASQEAAEFGMASKAPYLLLKGTVDSQIWATAHKTPRAYLEYSVPADWNPAWGAPPKPERTPFVPNAAAYESAVERWRRQVQAAMGIMPLPTSAQRQNEKSGIALERIQTQEAVGSFHITDNFVRALDNTGRQLNELITKLAELDSLPKQLLGKDQKGEDQTLNVVPRVTEEKLDPASEHLPESDQFFAHRGQFEVTISDGPNYQSQREEQSSFVDTLLQSLPSMGLPPALVQELVAIAVRMKNLGSFGDEIADLLAPPQNQEVPPQARAALANAQGQIQLLQQELQQLRMEKLGKVVEYQAKNALAEKEIVGKMAEADKDRETRIAVAEIMTKAQNMSERIGALEDLMKQFHQQAHERGMQAEEHAQAQRIAEQQAAAASAQSAQDAAQQAAQQQVSAGPA